MHNFYCPNPECLENKNPKEKSFIKSGTYKRINQLTPDQVYCCTVCRRRFTERIFIINYRNRKDDLHQQILEDVLTGSSNCSMARRNKVCETTIRNRLKQLHYYCNLRMAKEIEEINYPHIFL